MELTGQVIICGASYPKPEDAAMATAGAIYDWAHGVWGPLDVELTNEEGVVVGSVEIESSTFDKSSAKQTYSLAEIRNGTGWPKGARFVLVGSD